MQELKPGFKKTINWNKYQSKVTMQAPNQYLDYLIDSSFQRPSILPFENTADRTAHTKYYISTTEIKYYNVIIDGQNFFDQPVKTDLRRNDRIWKIAVSQWDDYTTSCLSVSNCFDKYHKMIAIYLLKQQTFDADPKAYSKLILQKI